MVEQRTENPCVEVSIPSLTTNINLKSMSTFNSNTIFSSVTAETELAKKSFTEAVKNTVTANDVFDQLDKLRSLENGWLDGGGIVPVKEGLNWLSDYFKICYPKDLPVPCIYPTPEGGIQIEWTLNDYEISLDVDLNNYIGDFHALNMSNDDEIIKSFDFNKPDDCVLLNQEINAISEAEV